MGIWLIATNCLYLCTPCTLTHANTCISCTHAYSHGPTQFQWSCTFEVVTKMFWLGSQSKTQSDSSLYLILLISATCKTHTHTHTHTLDCHKDSVFCIWLRLQQLRCHTVWPLTISFFPCMSVIHTHTHTRMQLKSILILSWNWAGWSLCSTWQWQLSQNNDLILWRICILETESIVLISVDSWKTF